MQLPAEQTSLEPLPRRVGPDGRRPFKEPERTRRRQPIHERHQLGPTFKGPRPLNSQGGFKQVADSGSVGRSPAGFGGCAGGIVLSLLSRSPACGLDYGPP